MFKKTTGLMSEEESIRKYRAIHALGIDLGYVQRNEEDGKWFLTMELRKEIKSDVLNILR